MKNNLVDLLVFEKNSLIQSLNDDEKKEIDIYFEDLIKELQPAIQVLDKLSTKEDFLENVKEAFKEEIKEEKWLEKLSKTFYDLEHIQKQSQTQTE